MTHIKPPSAELFIATGCSHCPLVLKELGDQLKKGKISSLNITNIAVDNTKADALNIRSVPWFSLINDDCFMIFSGNYSEKEIQHWINTSQNDTAMQEYIEDHLSNGQLLTVVQAIQLKPEIFSAVISMLEDEDTSMDIRIGLDSLIEHFSSSEMLKNNSDSFKNIAATDSPRLQIDALHYIALTADTKNKKFLQEMTKHKNQQIKEAAVEALETLNDLID